MFQDEIRTYAKNKAFMTELDFTYEPLHRTIKNKILIWMYNTLCRVGTLFNYMLDDFVYPETLGRVMAELVISFLLLITLFISIIYIIFVMIT